ncbi:MAG: hypothetical protein QOD99_2570 [Chthoniobacter sp.]|nr:hypothetical protein [Chthoniobacter sp.]
MRHLFAFALVAFAKASFASATEGPSFAPDAVVAADGSAQYTGVQEAINGTPQSVTAANPWNILVKSGSYKELIYVQREKRFVHLIGENPEGTFLTYDLSPKVLGPDGKPLSTFRTPTAIIDADDFVVENITFQNNAGQVGQALALRVDGDRVAFRNCRFFGYQDTIFINRGRQYFENCYIAGAVDFIFGGATAFFEKCRIECIGDGYVTAASTPETQPFGFVFSNCKITGVSPEVKAYLGRPWRAFSSVAFLNTEMSEVVRPVGWQNWGKPERESTVRYSEYNNSGAGAAPEARVKWVHPLTAEQAAKVTLQTVVGGTDGWNPQAGKVEPAAGTKESTSAPDPSRNPESGERKKDIQYGMADGEPLLLDAAIPDGPGPFPVAVIVHGGGWSSGSKEGDTALLVDPLTKAGLASFSINYRLAPKARWPACFEDVQAAIRWTKAHASEYKGDPNRIALIGYSAGGQLVCQAAVCATEDTRVQAVVGFSAPTDLVSDSERRGGLSISLRNLLDRPEQIDDETREILRKLSPLNYIMPGLPPFLLLHGTADKSVPYEQSVNFQKKLQENQVTCDLVTIQDAPHRLSEWGKMDSSYADKLTAWLQQRLGKP